MDTIERYSSDLPRINELANDQFYEHIAQQELGKRSILHNEIRSYEVSLWTLQDEFITVLKWSDAEQRGSIQDPKITLNVDGTQNFSFAIPMYMYIEQPDDDQQHMVRLVKQENPIWYNTRNGNLIVGLRKIKVIFNKGEIDNEEILEFVIIKITESHEQDMLVCNIECEGLAFHELGKVGYKINLSQANFELDYQEWMENGKIGEEPIQSISYWCDQAGLTPWPGNNVLVDPRVWYYDLDMNWSSFSGASGRVANKIYEEPYVSSWDNNLIPLNMESYREKARPVEISQSNLYNITQTIAEQFGIHCRYEYQHDDNYHIIAKKVVFYNNYNKEDEGFLSFIYPYSAKKISRNVDTTDLTTKLFVQTVSNNVGLAGDITIMNSDANKTKEDYILSFDYMHKIGGITDEQYDGITIFEKDIREVNEKLIPLQSELEALNNKKIEVEADLTTFKNSIKIDQEQYDNTFALFNSLDKSDGENDGYITIEYSHPDTGFIVTNTEGKQYINMTNTNKGIDVDSIEVFRTWNAGQGTCTDKVGSFSCEYDKFGNLECLTGIEPIIVNNLPQNKIYLTYRYKPILYYEKIGVVWKTKLANDTDRYKECLIELGPTSIDNDIDYDLATVYSYYMNQSDPVYENATASERRTAKEAAYNNGLNKMIKDKEELIERYLAEKEESILAFERMMGPALREGYWTPENYNDYGDIKQKNLNLPSESQNSNIFTTLSDDDLVLDWDDILFKDEDDIYYKVGVNEEPVYYPCINLSTIFSENEYNIRENIDKYSFIFNTNYYNQSAPLEYAQYTRGFSVGSEALLKFVRNGNIIFPVLVLVGAKTMTDDQITFMKEQGNPRLGIMSTSIINNQVIINVENSINLDASYWTFGDNINIENCQIVYPRLKFNNINVKADTNNLKLIYNGTLLMPYEDYSIITRVTRYGSGSNIIDRPEYYITLRPETLWKNATYSGNLEVHYIISNVSTSVYLDALEVAKTNSEPKVEYDLEANIIDQKLIHTLYKNLARIILINDHELKLENAFGYISQIDMELDKPSNDRIEIKNYSSKFEDLFSTIVAQTEAMKKNSAGIAVAMGGGVPLSEEGVSQTLETQYSILQEYLDSYFDNSQVVKDKLASLFNEAGEILGDSNKALNQMSNLTLANAEILSGFAQNVHTELSPKIYRSDTRPESFKVGDIWIQSDGNGQEIHYVATSNSMNSGVGASDGFVRTYDGTLASITGAALNIDAAAGTVELLAQNRIDMKSGGNIYIAANEKIDIVGNKSVNIGGTTINIGSTVINDETVVGGINIVATSYATNNFSNAETSKVLIHSNEIKMAGSKINLLTGTSNNSVSAIDIDGSKGIWIGSNKSIKLFSGTDTSGSNVELTPSHILFGVSNLSSDDNAAVEITDEYMIFAVGNKVDDLESSDINISGNLIGMKLTKEKIGLAVGTGVDRSVFIADQNGIIIGSGATPVTNTNNKTGSYVSISGSGIEIGSLANLYLNTNNVKLQTDSSYGTRFALGTNLQNTDNINGVSSNTTVGLVYNTNGLFIRGNIYADNGTFNGTVNASTFIATATGIGKLKADANGLGFYNTGDSAILTLSSSTLTVASGYTLSIGGNFNISSNNLQINSNPGTGANYFYVGDAINSNPTKYIKYTQNGTLEVKGDIIASSFKLATNNYSGLKSSDISDFNTAVNNLIEDGDFSIDGLSYVENWANTNKNYVSLTSTGGLLIGANNGIIIPSAANNAENPYLLINEDGIELNGKHILINGQQEWSRDDIVIMKQQPVNPWEDTVEHIEQHMKGYSVTIDGTTYPGRSPAASDWVLIKPYYGTNFNFSWNGPVSLYDSSNTLKLHLISPSANPYFGDGVTYTYVMKCTLFMPTSTYVQILLYADNSNGIQDHYDIIPNLSGAISTTGESAPSIVTQNNQQWIKLGQAQVQTLTLRLTSTQVNLCKEGFDIYAEIKGTNINTASALTIHDIALECECSAVTGRVPCTVYYYP